MAEARDPRPASPIGAFLAPIVVGGLAAGGRWHLGFGAAAVGMARG